MAVDCGQPDATPSPEGDEPVHGSYFVSTYPPFSTWNDGAIHRVREALAVHRSEDDDTPLGLYVHVPFCAKRCHYCYYLSYADPPPARVGEYLEAVIRELSLYREMPALSGRRPSFVYFGGGTPSLLEPRDIEQFTGRLRELLPWTDVTEATFECAPQSVTKEKLRALRQAGITRVSIGVQQLDDDILEYNGRIHLVRDAEQAYYAARHVGFDVVNVDLIVGLIGETEDSFDRTIDRVIAWAPESVTIYQLEIPLNTPLYHVLSDGSLDAKPLPWDVKRSRLGGAFERLERAGYTVRSAYAAVRDPAKHGFVYQDAQYRGADLLGLGAASFSYLDGVHHQNHAGLKPYLNSLWDDALPHYRAHALSDDERITREFVLQLKLGRVDVVYFRKKFAVDVTHRFADALGRCQRDGWLIVTPDEVTLTRPGLLRADRLCPAFYAEEYRGVRYS